MIIKCFRCGKDIDTPDSLNADYVIAKDTMDVELREVLFALKHNQTTLAKQEKDEPIEDNEFDAIEIPNIEAAKGIGEGLVKVVAQIKEVDIQKTGIVCPGCYKPTDTVIWGTHKKKGK